MNGASPGYNLASNQFTGLNAITVPGTRRDSLSLLGVVLEQETELEPKEIMTGTAGYPDTIFGIFHLLGYQVLSSHRPHRRIEVLARRP